MPFFLQMGASSSGLIGREASETSVSPAQNFSNPPPVPEVPTEIFTFGFSPLNCSAAAWAKGPTVLEPSILMLPETPPPPPPPPPLLLSSSLPQAATPRARPPTAASVRSFLIQVFSLESFIDVADAAMARLPVCYRCVPQL